MTLVLSNPTNVTLASTSAVGTIFDVDAAPTVNISSVTAYEGHQALFEVTLSSASEKSISVGYTTTSDSATAGSDYRSTSGTLVFAPGQTSKIVAVTTLRDAEQEPPRNILRHALQPGQRDTGHCHCCRNNSRQHPEARMATRTNWTRVPY